MIVVIEEHTKEFAAQEMEALKNSGLSYQVIEATKIFDFAPEIKHGDGQIFLRTSVQTAEKYENIYRSWFLNKDSSKVAEWYKLPRDNRWFTYFGRNMAHLDITKDNDGECTVDALKPTLKALIRDNGIFVKSTNKSSLTAQVFGSIDKAKSHVDELIAFGCHRIPQGLIISEVIDIDEEPKATFNRHEYRLFVIDGRVATASIFTDKSGYRVGNNILEFGNSFADSYTNDLPKSYCLDVALVNKKPVVVELNDIHASGLFADHNMADFYAAIKKSSACRANTSLVEN